MYNSKQHHPNTHTRKARKYNACSLYNSDYTHTHKTIRGKVVMDQRGRERKRLLEGFKEKEGNNVIIT